jgi:uncharacterized protein YggE
MYIKQQIDYPIGVTVFGSAIVRVAPDVASLKFSVTRLAQKPNEAFKQVREESKQVREYLANTRFSEVASSRLTLSQTFHWVNNENQFQGYTARADFHLLLDDLEQLETVTSELVDAGVNVIQSVDFQTKKLKQIRAEARKRAVAAAQEKAQLYCQAAGVELGCVLHIEDVDPGVLNSADRDAHSHAGSGVTPEDEETMRAIDPGSIIVGAAVLIAYALES